ncbi:hypothetical protein LE191_05615 [Janthinobacterium sp. HSC-3S05]|uniref:hypothetical protein n=1 Tax=Janthinobacterium lividum TaxID=29581 RepID=UPI001CD8A622|nr:hypothetical protein [Janthinobacterium lividum]MCA1859582.1 hypothetical protein [Janthinobacterium lividum]
MRYLKILSFGTCGGLIAWAMTSSSSFNGWNLLSSVIIFNAIAFAASLTAQRRKKSH